MLNMKKRIFDENLAISLFVFNPLFEYSEETELIGYFDY